MSTPSMDVFSLRDAVVDEYKKFATSFTTIHAEDIRRQVEAIYAEGALLAGTAHPGQPELQAGHHGRQARGCIDAAARMCRHLSERAGS